MEISAIAAAWLTVRQVLSLRKPRNGRENSPTSLIFSARLPYRLDVLPGKAPKTRHEQDKQLHALTMCFGQMPRSQIEPQHVRQYLEARTAKVAGNREKALLSHVLTKAREWGIMAGANPCAAIRGFAERARSRYVSDEDLKAILAKADAPLAACVRLAYLTAQRPADVLKLRRSDVRVGFLHVEQNKSGAKLQTRIKPWLPNLFGTGVWDRFRCALARENRPPVALRCAHGSQGPRTCADVHAPKAVAGECPLQSSQTWFGNPYDQCTSAIGGNSNVASLAASHSLNVVHIRPEQ